FRTELTRGDFEDPVPGLLRLTDIYDNRVDLLLGLRYLGRRACARYQAGAASRKSIREPSAGKS
ncbi:MAG: hypothetical protein J2P13_04205, partial [Acidobacteria bacterium]|nr:hypothetical protein [Acidobacteriota bacterium]